MKNLIAQEDDYLNNSLYIKNRSGWELLLAVIIVEITDPCLVHDVFTIDTCITNTIYMV